MCSSISSRCGSRPARRLRVRPLRRARKSRTAPSARAGQEAYHTYMRVRELAEWLGATFEGDGEKELTGVAPIESAGAGEVAFVGGRKAVAQAESSTAGCL